MVGIRTCEHPVENLKMRRRWWRYYGLRNLLDFEETIFQFPVVLEMHMNHMTNYHVETKSDKTMSCLYLLQDLPRILLVKVNNGLTFEIEPRCL
jgi:hypothetical protein